MGSADLLVAAGDRGPILQNARRLALPVAGRVAETIQKIACRPRRFGDARLRIARDERALVIDDVAFALH